MFDRRRWTATLLATSSLALVACAPNPPSGNWLFVDTGVVQNTCNNNDATPNDGNFTLLNNQNGTFTVDPEDGSDPFNCVLDGENFSCPDRVQDTIQGLNASIEVSVSIVGFFDSDTYAEGTQKASVTCTGDGCGAAQIFTGIDFPCIIEESFTASFKG
ncbi:MAG: hypothetical protein KC420_08460 [Myxococcales bacterium]|nr:hypothetical protein [Myxococcales bacterium]MCB9567939.1 hypothetical protein [Myxococcales bacterium]MCB9700386.1 hypothetical protein [Myxococcales bacterium]